MHAVRNGAAHDTLHRLRHLHFHGRPMGSMFTRCAKIGTSPAQTTIRWASGSGCMSSGTSMMLEEEIKLHRFAGISPEHSFTEAGRHREAVVAVVVRCLGDDQGRRRCAPGLAMEERSIFAVDTLLLPMRISRACFNFPPLVHIVTHRAGEWLHIAKWMPSGATALGS